MLEMLWVRPNPSRLNVSEINPSSLVYHLSPVHHFVIGGLCLFDSVNTMNTKGKLDL